MPSLNTENAILSNAIKVDSSYNVGIGGGANASFKFIVSGASAFSGNNASIAAISGYVGGVANNPIITFARGGSAVAGALGYDDPSASIYAGTTTNHNFLIKTNNSTRLTIDNAGAATFSSSVTATSAVFANSSVLSTVMGSPQLRLINNAAATANQRVDLGLRWEDGTYNGIGGISMIRESATARSGTIVIQPINSSGDPLAALSIASTGAATFSSSITAATTITGKTGFSTAGVNASPVFEDWLNCNPGATTPTKIQVGNSFAQSAGTWMKFVVNSNTANNTPVDVMTFRYDGNVGIGTSSPSSLLHVAGGGTSTRGALRLSDQGGANFWEIGRDNNVSGDFTFNSNASERMRITSGGDVGIGNTGFADSKLTVTGKDNTGSNYIFIAKNFGSNNMFLIRNDGLLISRGMYDFTTGGGANVNVDADGLVRRSTSSLKYKNNVQDYTKGLADVMQMRPVTYNSNNEDETQTYAGLIAEEIHEIGLTEFVQYAADGSPDALSYGNMVSLLVKSIQELKAEIDELKNR